ncbi:MAG: hypothetical protein WB762_31745 [Candidatus Sulfotelmatobacter sp.]
MRLARSQPQCVLRVCGMAMQAVDFGHQGQRVPDGGVDRCPLRYPDQRSRTLWCATCLGKRVDIAMAAALIPWIPHTGAEFEPQLQDTVLELSGRRTVVVRHYQLQQRIFSGSRQCC